MHSKKLIVRGLYLLSILLLSNTNLLWGQCMAGYEPTPSTLAISTNGNFAIQGGATGGGISNSPTYQNPATTVGTYNATSGIWSQARHITDGTYTNPNSTYNVYSLMTGSKPANTFFTGSLLNSFPGDPANNVAPTETYFYSNGNVFGYGTQKEYVIWGQTLTNLVVGRQYTFSIYVNNAIQPPANATDDPIVRLRIGGNPGLPDGTVVAGPTTLTETLTASTQPLQGWIRVAYAFTATATTATFKVTSAAPGEGGDDFQMTQVQIVACRPILTLSSNGPICATQTLQLTATTPATGNFTYAWTGPNNFSSTLQNPQITNISLSGAGTYTCTITDGNGQTNTQTIVVMVNDCIRDDVNAGIVNQPIPGNVKTNDVAGSVSYGTPVASSTNPAGGTITMNSDGSYSFQASAPGVYTYDVPVCLNGQLTQCPTTKLVITVTDPSGNTNPPIANTDFSIAPFNTAVSLPILANDGPGNLGGVLGTPTITGGTNPGATATISGGNLVYTPSPGFVGKDTVYYQVCESPSNICTQAAAIITVLPSGAVNTTSATDDYGLAQLNTPVSGNVKTNDMDPEGNTTSVTSQNTTIAGKGTLVLSSDGTYTFTPVSGFIGTVDLPYTICDNQSPQACASATLHIVVTNAQALPVIFGSISAEYINGMLVIKWSTLFEKNNSGFELEASQDGINFQKIGSLSSKAMNGNSELPLSYTFSKKVTDFSLAAMGVFMLLLMVSFKRNYKMWLFVLFVGIAPFFFTISCNKSAEKSMNKNEGNTYVRVVQVNHDGTKNYSRIVTIIKN